jgi:phosphoserine phosphatase
MKKYITLVSNNFLFANQEIIAELVEIIQNSNSGIKNRVDLKENQAIELEILAITDSLRENIKPFSLKYQIDYFLQQENEKTVKKLIIFDMDSTIIENECIDEIARYAGKYNQMQALTEDAMQGNCLFEDSLIKRVKLLKGISADVLHEIYETKLTFSAKIKEFTSAMRAHGAILAVASGGFTFFTSLLASELGFSHHYANTLEIIDNKLTGNILKPIFSSESKLHRLKELMKLYNLKDEQVMAIGDGANDIPMLTHLTSAIAYKAKKAVRAQTNHALTHTDFESLLYFQGLKN